MPREGKALLHGIVYCGECGHKMCVQYKGGTQYLCNHLKQQTGAPVCQRIGGDAIDDAVVAWFFEALSVAEIDVAASALQTTDTEHEQIVAAHEQEVERLRYESQLAERQFMKSDPDNRLVTGELERRWETSLRELKGAEEELDRLRQDAPSYIIPEDLGVKRWWISDRIHNGTIKAKMDEKKRCYLFPDTPATLAELKALVDEYQSKVGCGKGHQDD